MSALRLLEFIAEVYARYLSGATILSNPTEVDQKAGPRYWNKHHEAFASPFTINSGAIRIGPGNRVECDVV